MRPASERATSVLPPEPRNKPRKAFFCYEYNKALRYGPVIYYDEVPRRNECGRRQVVEISQLPTGPDGEFDIFELEKRFPLELENADD